MANQLVRDQLLSSAGLRHSRPGSAPIPNVETFSSTNGNSLLKARYTEVAHDNQEPATLELGRRDQDERE